jgi:hypothetical protein
VTYQQKKKPLFCMYQEREYVSRRREYQSFMATKRVSVVCHALEPALSGFLRFHHIPCGKLLRCPASIPCDGGRARPWPPVRGLRARGWRPGGPTPVSRQPRAAVGSSPHGRPSARTGSSRTIRKLRDAASSLICLAHLFILPDVPQSKY